MLRVGEKILQVSESLRCRLQVVKIVVVEELKEIQGVTRNP